AGTPSLSFPLASSVPHLLQPHILTPACFGVFGSELSSPHPTPHIGTAEAGRKVIARKSWSQDIKKMKIPRDSDPPCSSREDTESRLLPKSLTNW
ncbi:unnamed protein product, partial [Gulo gulo]